MTIKQPLFQQNDTTDQAADITRLFIRDIMNGRTGRVQETAFQVQQRGAGANNSVDVLAGGFIIAGTENSQQGSYYVVNDATVNLPMSTAANGSLPRIDSVLIDVRDSQYSGSNNDSRIVYQAGTAAASPVQPDLVALGYKNFYRLANINVPANDNTIITSDITDTRTDRVSAVGGVIVCTSSTRPSSPRPGQIIWETDNAKLLVNIGSAASPNWVGFGTSIVAQQTLLADGATFSTSTLSDFALNNVPVVSGHTYGITLSTGVIYAGLNASSGWRVRLRLNGTNIATLYDFEPGMAGSIVFNIGTTAYWVAPTTQASDDFTVFCELVGSGTNFTFHAASTVPRWLTITDLGIL